MSSSIAVSFLGEPLHTLLGQSQASALRRRRVCAMVIGRRDCSANSSGCDAVRCQDSIGKARRASLVAHRRCPSRTASSTASVTRPSADGDAGSPVACAEWGRGRVEARSTTAPPPRRACRLPHGPRQAERARVREEPSGPVCWPPPSRALVSLALPPWQRLSTTWSRRRSKSPIQFTEPTARSVAHVAVKPAGGCTFGRHGGGLRGRVRNAAALLRHRRRS